MAKTIVTLVDCESASWMDGDVDLLESVTIGKPVIFPCLSPEDKLALAKKVLGEKLRDPKTFERSTVIGSKGGDDLVALQFFDVEEPVELDRAAEDLRALISAFAACEECGGEGCDECGDDD